MARGSALCGVGGGDEEQLSELGDSSEKSHPWTPLVPKRRSLHCGGDGCASPSCLGRDVTMGARHRRVAAFLVVGTLSLSLVVMSLVAAVAPPPARGSSSHDSSSSSHDDDAETATGGPVPPVGVSSLLATCEARDVFGVTASCASSDRRRWCEAAAKRSNVASLCFSACLGEPSWMAQCAWQAISRLEQVCEGTFEPVPPADLAAAAAAERHHRSERDDDACEIDAACAACRSASCAAVVDEYKADPRTAVLRALDDDLDEWCSSGKKWTAPRPIDQATLEQTWGSSASSGSVLALEEHYLYSEPAARSGVFLQQAYSFWRFALQPKVEATTRSYFSVDALLDALSQRELAAGAMVFLDVAYQAMDTAYSTGALESSISKQSELPVSMMASSDPSTDLDFLCVYQHTPSLIKRSKLLRALLAYERPLVIVLAGDFDCRLNKKSLPDTHHFVIFPNDGACASQVGGRRRLWWPEGLEGLTEPRDLGPTTAVGGFAADALKLVASPPKSTEFLIDCAFSVTPRKPSRVALLDYLEAGGGRRDLQALSERSGRLRIRLAATLARTEAKGHDTSFLFDSSDDDDGDDEEEEEDDPRRRRRRLRRQQQQQQQGTSSSSSSSESPSSSAPPILALAPAGDTWSSGRVLEALLAGSIPVVDATYQTDGGASAKGCEDPAKFWRDGTDDFPVQAPFVFVDDWANLVPAIDAFFKGGSPSNATLLESRLNAVREYRERLLSYLRHTTLEAIATAQNTPPLSKDATSCTTTLLNETASDALTKTAHAYYSNDNWFDDFPDSPTYPGSGCTTRYFTDGRLAHGAMCFAPDCAPPNIRHFECHSLRDAT